MKKKGKQQRRESRYRASFPVEIEGDQGRIIDMSPSGLAFESTREYAVGDELGIVVQVGRLGASSGTYLECKARVVRVQKTENGVLVGASVEWSDDEAVDKTLV